MSATPAREGLLQLQGEGFLKMNPGRGFVVMPLSVQDICDAFEAQALLGGELCARAASLLDEHQLREIEEIQESLEKASAAAQLDQVEQLNFKFHRSIYSHAAAPVLHRLLGFTVRYAPREFYPTIEGWPEATNRDHRAILEALRAGDADSARQAMLGHVRGAGELLAKHIDSLRPSVSGLYGGTNLPK
jgi:DNA-binding GntR family transcriptional regulator